MLEEPDAVAFAPLSIMSNHERDALEEVTSSALHVFPEIESRAFLRACGAYRDPRQIATWIVVQPGQYTYSVAETGGVQVQLVIGEYLACSVIWE